MKDPAADERWRAKQAHYQDAGVVERYEAERFRGARSRGDAARMARALERALAGQAAGVRSVLDVPCGTGRMAPFLARDGRELVQADLSRAMLASARAQGGRLVATDALALGFGTASFDLVVCLRFLFHVPTALQPRVLAELARVSRRWVAVDVRHGWAWSALARRARARLSGARVSPRLSPREIGPLFEQAGLVVRGKVFFAPGFSEKVLVLAEKRPS